MKTCLLVQPADHGVGTWHASCTHPGYSVRIQIKPLTRCGGAERPNRVGVVERAGRGEAGQAVRGEWAK